MKNFIVPIDFSKDSLKGLDIAVLFSQKMHVNIQMVYVQKASEDYRPGSFEEEHKFAEANFKKILDEYGRKLKHDSKLRSIIKKGRIYKEIVSQVESYNDGVISASTHGASGFEDFFIGSNAFKIISSTSKPVFTINKGHAPKSIKRIIVPIQLHVDTRQKVPWATDIAEIFGAEIHLICISASNNKKDNARLNAYYAQSIDYVNRRKVNLVTKKLSGDGPSSLVITYATAVNADIVTITSEKSSGWNMMMGSYAQDILNKCPSIVLSITAKEKHIPIGFSTIGEYNL
jgi:nucleotide-binding universal stress UspA family protein